MNTNQKQVFKFARSIGCMVWHDTAKRGSDAQRISRIKGLMAQTPLLYDAACKAFGKENVIQYQAKNFVWGITWNALSIRRGK